MDKTYPPDAWKRLGKALEARRGELGYGFRRRRDFLADRGGPPPSEKMLARLERGERTSYPPATAGRLESLYELAPGAFEAFLQAGGDKPLEPLPSPPRPALVPPLPSPGALAAWLESSPDELIRQVFSRDDVLSKIWALPMDQRKRIQMIEVALADDVDEDVARQVEGDAG
jgi:hypothetical protein